jgi:hypothetical protein
MQRVKEEREGTRGTVFCYIVCSSLWPPSLGCFRGVLAHGSVVGTGDFVGLIGTGVRRLKVSPALVDVLVDPGDSNGTRWEVLKSG